jgi:hypothetical protein
MPGFRGGRGSGFRVNFVSPWQAVGILAKGRQWREDYIRSQK